MLSVLALVFFPHAWYPAGNAWILEITGLLGLLGCGTAATALSTSAERIGRTVQDRLNHQPDCAYPIGDGFTISLIAEVISP